MSRFTSSMISAGQVHASTLTICMFDSSFYETVFDRSSRSIIDAPSAGKRDDENTQPSRKRPAGLGLGLPSSGPRRHTSRPLELETPPSPSPESCLGMISSSTSISSGLSLAAANNLPPRKRPTGLGLGIPSLKFKHIHAQETDKSNCCGMLSVSDSVSSGLYTASGNAPAPFAACKRAFSSRASHLQISKFAKRTLFTIPEDGPIPDFKSGTIRVVKKMLSSQIIGSLSHKSLF
ncbi:hypothetical protein BDZ89DRAFT_1059517 [Hymenopellis radicata]|nr:hypothetical protein BDZ89DRAFT_1059517 [Hymenopellis radicata]